MFINATNRQQISIYSIGPYWYLLACTSHLEKWGYNFFFTRSARESYFVPHLKIRGAVHGYRSHDQNGNFRKFKMAVGRHIENRFSVISWRHCSRCVWKLDSRCRIACKQRSRDRNSNFRQFNMAPAATL